MLAFLALALPVALARGLPTTTSTQSPQANYLGLSASADQVIERNIDVTFSCANRRLGYYADVANDCKVFHICNPVNLADGQHAVMQYSFFCPANSFFDQQAMTCVKEISIPCGQSERYHHVNDQLGKNDLAGVRRQHPQVAAPVPAHHQPQQQQYYPQAPQPAQQPNAYLPNYPQQQQQQQVFPTFNQLQGIPQPQNFAQPQNFVNSVLPGVLPSSNVVRAG